MKIYTRTGDGGETGLFAGPRVAKDHLRIESYGTVDELNAYLGLVRCEDLPKGVDRWLERIQNDLFSLGADLATPDAAARGFTFQSDKRVETMELAIDQFETELVPLQQFILPGGCRAAALLHVARTICRRAERRLVSLIHTPNQNVSPGILPYLNRLSDFLFVLARLVNARANQSDVPWKKES